MCVPGTVEIVRARLEAQPPPRIEAPRVSRRAALLAGAGTALAAAVPRRAFGQRGDAGGTKLADLTHTYSDAFPLFPGAPPTTRTTLVTVQNDGLYGQQWTLFEHACTHMDAPAHFAVDGRTIEQLQLSELIAPAVVIDIAERAAKDPDTVVTPADLRAYERRHGRIPKGAVVCMHSGWEERAGSVEAYLNADAGGVLHFPGFGKQAAEWLLAERDIRGIGVDTLSLDHGSSASFDVHLAVLPADRYGIENLRGLAAIPPRGATIYLGVVPWRDGSGGPCRAFAAW
jgi:kynurenine formamidase